MGQKNIPIILFILLLSCGYFSSPIYAQQDSTEINLGRRITPDASSIFRNAGKIFSAPLHFDGTDWIITSSVLAGTVVLFTTDEKMRSIAKRNHSEFGDNIFGFGREYGREIYGLSLSAGLYAGGIIFDDDETRETGIMLLESIAFSSAVTTVLKSLIGRSRPYMEEGAAHFRGFQFKAGTTSLPSGHTTVAFAVSSVLAGKIQNTLVSIVLYSAATLTAISRVYHDAHWLSDNFLGAAIATSVGLSIVKIHEQKENKHTIRVEPNGLGMKLVILF